MSVSFTWKPTDPNAGKYWGGGSSLHSAMVNVFGEFPFTLTRDHLGELRGISACGYKDVDELIDAILEHNSVDVAAVW